MGVCIQKCNKDSEKTIKESTVECYKKTEQSIYTNLITSNNISSQEKKLEKMRFKKMFNNNKNNKEISSPIMQQKKEKSVIKIQKFFRNYIKLRRDKEQMEIEIEKERQRIKEKEESPVLKMNLEMVETFFSSNSLNNSNISKENTNNNEKLLIKNNIIPFNIKHKLSNMHYKYSGYLKKKSKENTENNNNSAEEKEIIDNDENLIKEGFGKYTFADGTEFFGIFHNNTLETYGKYLFLNHKEESNNNGNNYGNNYIKAGDKEIIITDNNLNYEEFIGIYKNYIPDGFGIYTNLITNLKITGNFIMNGLYDIGIENSIEGGYTYYGEFKNNKKHGLGTIKWDDGSTYQGEFFNNQMNGYGMIEFPEKNYYQGEIKKGKMDGFGEFFWRDKKKYIGYYKNDKRNGFGVYLLKNNENNCDSDIDKDFEINNCSAFIGFWKNGNMDGFGMTVFNSEIKYGIWENGFKKKSLENNLSLQSYAKWMNKNFNRLFWDNKINVLDFLKTICDINNEFENSGNS